MIRRQAGGFPAGYTVVAGHDAVSAARAGAGAPAPAAPALGAPALGMEFGVLRLESGAAFRDAGPTERAFHLFGGSVEIEWEGRRQRAGRSSMLEELPVTLHVPPGIPVSITALSPWAELGVYKIANPRPFPARFIAAQEVEVARLAPAKLSGTADREIRTILDGDRDSHANFAVGEIVNQAGKWSSYPPHHHPQWEIYHFRFFPADGFGYSEQGEGVFKILNGDTAVIPPGLTHPQCAAPGYAMVYAWAIPHLPRDRFGSKSRVYVPQHQWTLG